MDTNTQTVLLALIAAFAPVLAGIGAAVTVLLTKMLTRQGTLQKNQTISANAAAAQVLEVKTTLAAQSNAAALEAEEVKSALAAHTADIAGKAAIADQKLDTIHALVNSSMTAQLRITATALRALADHTGSETDRKAAAAAEAVYAAHLKTQAAADALAADGPIAPTHTEGKS